MKPVMKAVAVTTLSSLIALGGCATGKKVVVQVDPAVVKLNEAAADIAESYRQLSYAENARNSPDNTARGSIEFSLNDFPAEWRESVALQENYYGELEPFIRGLCKLVGYDDPQIIGPSPVVPITLTVNKDRRPIADFLVDAGYQAGDRAKVILDEEHSRIQIVYPR